MNPNYKNIVLIGMPGCGKTTIGKNLAQTLGWTFYDMDQYIEQQTGQTVAELFKIGEPHFRRVENRAVQDLCGKTSIVLATGGGVVTQPANMALLQQNGILIYIERPIDLIIKSADLTTRPLLTENVQKIYALYNERKTLYEQYCHYRILNNRSLDTAVKDIITILIDHRLP